MMRTCPVGPANIQRFPTNPLITPASSPTLGDNINGPSVIRVPGWLPNPLGKFYMYFAHHAGSYIRLAYADDLQGPWHIYEPGTLHLKDAEAFHDHIASPDVHVDNEAKQIRMYFHGPVEVDMAGNWLDWQPTEPVEVLRPSEEYEGVRYPVVPSGHGSAVGVNQLREPFVMAGEDGWTIFYTCAGEADVCGAKLISW